ncbi:MAG: ABC transporter permease, partial [Planctomycetota bacterium]
MSAISTSATLPPQARAQPRHRFGVAGRIGFIVFTTMVLVCVLSLPWSLGAVGGTSSAARIARSEASNLSLNLLPPAWSTLNEGDTARVTIATDAGQYIPGRILGTDRLGRDVFARLLAGGAVSLLVGISAASVAVIIGTLYGALAGAAGGKTDAVLMRIVDILFGLPSILLVVLLAVAVDGFLERRGEDLGPVARQLLNIATLLAAIGGVSWLTMARVIRGQVLSLRAQPFMESCRAIGVSPMRQFFRHLLPNLIGPITVYAALAVPAAILSEGFLSFLGIGVREPLPSWGNLCSDALPELNPIESRWWLLA